MKKKHSTLKIFSKGHNMLEAFEAFAEQLGLYVGDKDGNLWIDNYRIQSGSHTQARIAMWKNGNLTYPFGSELMSPGSIYHCLKTATICMKIMKQKTR